MSDTPTTTINAVIAALDIKTPVPNADWGRMFADALLDTDDIDAIRYALADAGEKYRSSALSKARKHARTSVRNAIRHRGENGTAQAALSRQLAFEVGFEGVAPRPLIDTTHEFLVEAEAYMERLYQGTQENLLFIRNAIAVTRAFPGTRVGELIERGLLLPDAFVVEQAA